MDFTWDNQAKAGYISLLSAEERVAGVAETTVPLDSLDEASEIGALHSILLDFDRDGKLIGIEIVSPETRSATRR